MGRRSNREFKMTDFESRKNPYNNSFVQKAEKNNTQSKPSWIRYLVAAILNQTSYIHELIAESVLVTLKTYITIILCRKTPIPIVL